MDKTKLLALKTSLNGTKVATKATEIRQLIAFHTDDDSKAKKLVNDMMGVVKSEEFIIELDKKIGDVRENETEEEFVMRGKAIIKNILRKKFD
ncbi:hypothetical protein [Pantoea agglomerans]|uniref:hypothetical protein n=1 Tax=Enterobacter agglomerans TaxID=549 RepID=UPI00315AD09D